MLNSTARIILKLLLNCFTCLKVLYIIMKFSAKPNNFLANESLIDVKWLCLHNVSYVYFKNTYLR